MRQLKLNKIEYSYLFRASFLPSDLKNLLSISWKQVENDDFLLTLTEDQVDEFRDLFGEQLQIVGFDEDYKPTYEGELLESLIDKFFCG